MSQHRHPTFPIRCKRGPPTTIDLVRIRLLLLLALVLSACAGGDVIQPVINAPDDSPVRLQLEWFAAALEQGSISKAEYSDRFTEDFRARVSFEASFLPVLADMSAVAGEWHLIGLDLLSDHAGEGVLAAAGERMRVTVTIDPNPPHRIADLLAQPVMLTLPPDTYEEVVDPLRRYGDVAFLSAHDASCSPVFGLEVDRPVPLGSAVSLLVAAVVADGVAEGNFNWDTAVVIDAFHRSYPAGALAGVPDGESRTVSELLALSVAGSDNTATDHLMALVGPAALEEALAVLGVTASDRNSPFLSTRQLTALKAGGDRSKAAEYAAADQAGRTELLATLTEDVSSVQVPDSPVFIHAIEWFASPREICRVLNHLYLLSLESGMGPLADAFTANPGLAPDAGVWEAVWFVGGSEPGVLLVAWLTVSDETVAVTVGSISNSEKAFPAIDAALRFGAGRDLVADPAPTAG